MQVHLPSKGFFVHVKARKSSPLNYEKHFFFYKCIEMYSISLSMHDLLVTDTVNRLLAKINQNT